MKLRHPARIALVLAAATSLGAVGPDGTEAPTLPCEDAEQDLRFVEGSNTHEFAASAVTYPTGTVPGLTGDESIDDDPAGLDPLTRTSFAIQIDVSTDDADDNDVANLAVSLSWDSPSDHELFVYDADGNMLLESTAFNPIDGSQESGFIAGVEHCEVLTFETKNYLGVPAEPMTLDVRVSGKDLEPDTIAGEAVAPA